MKALDEIKSLDVFAEYFDYPYMIYTPHMTLCIIPIAVCKSNLFFVYVQFVMYRQSEIYANTMIKNRVVVLEFLCVFECEFECVKKKS